LSGGGRIVGHRSTLADDRPAFCGGLFATAGQGSNFVSSSGQGAAERGAQTSRADDNDVSHAFRE
jgi:hypothetical protein